MGLLRSSFEILPTTDIVDTTIYDQDGTKMVDMLSWNEQ